MGGDRRLDGTDDGLEIRGGQVDHRGAAGEPLEVGDDVDGHPVEGADGLEDAVAAGGDQIRDRELRGGRVGDVEAGPAVRGGAGGARDEDEDRRGDVRAVRGHVTTPDRVASRGGRRSIQGRPVSVGPHPGRRRRCRR